MKMVKLYSLKLRFFLVTLFCLVILNQVIPQRISELPPASYIGTGDLTAIVQNGVTKKLPYAALISSLHFFSDSIYVSYRCHKIKGISNWYFSGDTIFIDTCSATQGPGGATELNDLTDVTLTEPDAGDILIVDDESMQWVNYPISSIVPSSYSLDDLSDVTISQPADSNILMFDEQTNLWLNIPFPISGSGADELNDLSDVTLTMPDQGDILRLNETNQWVNVPFPYAPSGIENGEQGVATADQVYDFVTNELTSYQFDPDASIVTKGTVTSGSVNSLDSHDNSSWNLTEVTGTPGLDFIAIFDSVDQAVNRVWLHGYYTGNHAVEIQLYDYEDSAWETYTTMTQNSYSQWIEFSLPDPDDHRRNDSVKIRFYHPASGNVSHKIYIDFLSVVKTGSLSSGFTEDDPIFAGDSANIIHWPDTLASNHKIVTIKNLADTAFAIRSAIPDAVAPSPIYLFWDGRGGYISTGNTRYKCIAYSGTIISWSIVAIGTNPTCTIDIWHKSYATSLPTVTNTIMGTKPALSTGNVIRSSTMTGWSPVVFSAGDIFGFTIDNCSNATWISLTLEIQ